MWPINFQDWKRFHISLGLGLMVAAFLLVIFQQWNGVERLDVFWERCGEFLLNSTHLETLGCDTQVEVLSKASDDITKPGGILFGLGLFSFIAGYAGFLYEQTEWMKQFIDRFRY